MRLLGDRMSRRTAWKLAIEHDWDDLSAAEYLAVCLLQADAFVTVDPTMATRAEGIVPLAPVSALLGWRHHNGLTRHDQSDLVDLTARALGPEPSEEALEYDLALEAIEQLKHGAAENSLKLR